MSKLDTLIKELAKARADQARAGSAAKALLAPIQISEAYTQLVSQEKQAKAEVERLTEIIRTTGKTYYVKKNEKNPHEKVEVRIFKVARIEKVETVRQWLWKHLPDALVMNEDVISDYVQNVGPIPGVIIEDDPRVYIASKLE